MSKILIIGDLHMKYELSYASAIKDGRKSEWEDVKTQIINASKKCNEIVLLGDQLNSRHNHSNVLTEFVDFLNGFGEKEVHMLVGNHCRYGSLTALDFLKEIDKPKWHVYSEPTKIKLGEKSAMMVPYMSPALLGVDNNEEAAKILLESLKPADYLFIHHAISGTKKTEFFNEIVLDKEIISNLFKMTFAGHIHKKERIKKNILVTGSVFTTEIGEHEKSINIIDTDNYEEIPLPVRGIYKIDWDKDPDKIFEGIPTNSIVKCIVTTRGTDIELVRKTLKRFDASIIIEQYENERKKIHFEEGGLDLSIESLLKLYSETKNLNYADLKAGFELIK